MAPSWVLRPKERRILRILADTIVPRGGAFESGAEDIEIEGPFEEYLRGLDHLYAKVYRWHLRLFDYGPIIHRFKFRRFSKLSQEERVAYCQKLESHKRFGARMFLFLLKFLITFIAFSDPKLERAVGYVQECADSEAGS